MTDNPAPAFAASPAAPAPGAEPAQPAPRRPRLAGGGAELRIPIVIRRASGECLRTTLIGRVNGYGPVAAEAPEPTVKQGEPA